MLGRLMPPLARALRRTRPLTAIERNTLYDQQTVQVMQRVLRSSSPAVDVGAHVGAVLAHILAIAPDAYHVAVEPLPELASFLRRHFPTVDVQECALSDQPGTASFVYVRTAPAYSGLRPRDYDHADVKTEEIQVRTETLDRLIPVTRPIEFIKIDVEGGEYHVIRGGLAVIRHCKPVIVFEAAANSTGRYNVTAYDLYHLITEDCGMHLSTMARWLESKPPYSETEFRLNWDHGPEFYFIAYP